MSFVNRKVSSSYYDALDRDLAQRESHHISEIKPVSQQIVK